MKINESEIYSFLREVIQSDIRDGLLERLTKKPYIYTMCSNIIEHDETYLAQHSGRFTDILRLIPPKNDLKFLDVGAGVEFLSILLKTKFGFNVEAVDLEESVSFWAERFEKYGVPLKSCDISRSSLPFQDNIFDVVIFSEVIEHLTVPPMKVLGKIRTVLKEGGFLILTTPNFARASNIVKLILGKSILLQLRESGLISSPSTPHVREYTVGELQDLMKMGGFKTDKVRMSRCWDKKSTAILRFFNNMVTLVLPRFRSCIMIRAQRLD